MGKTFVDCLLLPHQRTSRPKFHGETFANSHKTVKFAKVFSIESFPLYSIWPSHWTKSVYHIEKLVSVVYFLGREMDCGVDSLA